MPSKYITCRLKAHTWALGHAKRLTIAGGQIDVSGEAQSRSVPAFYLDCWTICGQVSNVTVHFRIHDPPEDHKGTEISPAYAICQRDVVVNSIVAELTPEEVPQLEPVAVISPRDGAMARSW